MQHPALIPATTHRDAVTMELDAIQQDIARCKRLQLETAELQESIARRLAQVKEERTHTTH